MKNIILQGISTTELVEEITNSVLKELKDIIGVKNTSSSEDVMSKSEVCEYLKMSMSTLNRRIKEGSINCQYLGGKVFIKKSELPIQ